MQQGEVRALEECASHPVRRVSHPVVVGADQHLGENQGQHGRTALKRPKRLIGRGWPHADCPTLRPASAKPDGLRWHPGHIGPCLRHRRCAPESIGELTSAFFFYACTHGGPLGDIGSFAHMTHPAHTTRQEEIAEWLARPAALTRPLTTTLTPLVRALLL